MRVVIAEKPSVARAIVEAMGPGMEVTHCFGHLLELAQPHEYDPKLKSWDVSFLPIRVERWRLVPKPDGKAQLDKIAKLLSRATEVIHAGDPDREGQLLVDEVLEHCGWKGKTTRVLINATDAASIKKAFAKIEDNAKYRPLMLAAQCRQRADWLVGMNLSRAVTRLLSDHATISIGRVQTPTLALLVRRHREIQNFKPETFYTLRADVVTPAGAQVSLRHDPDPRLLDGALARRMAQAVQGQTTTLSVKTQAASRRAPLPFDLATFQQAAERFFGWRAAQSLAHLQAAYEAKLTSYPRTDCRYLPAEQAADALRIARAVSAELLNNPKQSAALLPLMQPAKRIYDSSKVAEHHGLVPTGVLPTAHTPEHLRQTWALVSLQFLASLLPDEQYEETVVQALFAFEGQELAFSARGEVPKNAGANWTALDFSALLGVQKRGDAAPPPRLPALSDGSPARAQQCEVIAGKTTPPKPYTEASLIADMRAVAKFVDDPKLKAKLKETSGIGTAATQAAIIETLKDRGFAASRGKILEPTELGMQVIDAIPPKLADPGVTAAWEDALSLVAEGRYDPSEFMRRIDAMVASRLKEVYERQAAGARIRARPPERSAPGKKSGSRPTSGRRARASSKPAPTATTAPGRATRSRSKQTRPRAKAATGIEDWL